MPLSATGDVTGDFDLPKDAALGYYSVRVGDSQEDAISGGFHVEDYRKPEYRVQVTAGQKTCPRRCNHASHHRFALLLRGAGGERDREVSHLQRAALLVG